jgi:hypothetical protein
VRERGIDAQEPQRHEDDGAAELHPLRRGARDERWRDDGEHQLIHHERQLRNRAAVVRVRIDADAAQQDVAEPADDRRPFAEAEAVADQRPQDRDQRHQREALHHDRERIFLADEPAVEQREPGARHHQDQRGADQHPGVVGRRLRGGHALFELRKIGLGDRRRGRREVGRLCPQQGRRQQQAEQSGRRQGLHMSLRSPVRIR